jgi:hypothetical protein
MTFDNVFWLLIGLGLGGTLAFIVMLLTDKEITECSSNSARMQALGSWWHSFSTSRFSLAQFGSWCGFSVRRG